MEHLCTRASELVEQASTMTTDRQISESFEILVIYVNDTILVSNILENEFRPFILNNLFDEDYDGQENKQEFIDWAERILNDAY